MGQCIRSLVCDRPSAGNQWPRHQFVCDECRSVPALIPFPIGYMSEDELVGRCMYAFDSLPKSKCDEHQKAMYVECLSIANMGARFVITAILITIIADCRHRVSANPSPLRNLDQRTIFFLIEVLIATANLKTFVTSDSNKTSAAVMNFQERVAVWAVVDVEADISAASGHICFKEPVAHKIQATPRERRSVVQGTFNVTQSHFLLWNIVYYSPWATSDVDGMLYCPEDRHRLSGTFTYTTECRLVRAFAAQVFLLDVRLDLACFFAIIPLDIVYNLARYIDRCHFIQPVDYYGSIDRIYTCEHGPRTDGTACSCVGFKCGRIPQPPSAWRDEFNQVKVHWFQAYHTDDTIGTYSYGMFEPVK